MKSLKQIEKKNKEYIAMRVAELKDMEHLIGDYIKTVNTSVRLLKKMVKAIDIRDEYTKKLVKRVEKWVDFVESDKLDK